MYHRTPQAAVVAEYAKDALKCELVHGNQALRESEHDLDRQHQTFDRLLQTQSFTQCSIDDQKFAGETSHWLISLIEEKVDAG